MIKTQTFDSRPVASLTGESEPILRIFGSANDVITPQARREGIQKAEIKENPSHLKLEEDMRFFDENYGEYFQGVTKSLGLDENQSRALIGHESRFVRGAKNNMGSRGYMQLTGSPIRDLESRPQIYAEWYRKIDISCIPPTAPRELKELVAVFQEGPAAYVRIKPLISGLLAKKDDPYVNIAIGSVYLAALKERIDAKSIPHKVDAFVEKRVNILGSGSFLSLVARRVRDILPQAETKAVKESLATLKNDADFQKRYLLLRDYNGNVARYSSGIEHRDIYAAAVLIIAELSKKTGEKGVSQFHSSTHDST